MDRYCNLYDPFPCSALFASTWRSRLWIAYAFGIAAAIAGLAFSYAFDFSCGPSVVSFIDKCQPEVVEKILRRCGLWKTAESRPPPVKSTVAETEPGYDYGYFDRVCI